MHFLHGIILMFTSLVVYQCVQIPTYNISLQHNEEFVISDLLSFSDVEDVYDDDEMIKASQNQLNKEEHAEKYWRLHRQSNARNNHKFQNEKPKMEPFWVNVTKEEYLRKLNGERNAVKADNNEGNLFKRNDENELDYFDDYEQSNRSLSYRSLEKRDENKQNQSKNNDTESYDYEAFKAAYENQLKLEEQMNDTYKYNETKEDESPEEAVKTLVDFSPRNCTKEEMDRLSFASVECLWIEAKSSHFDKRNKLYIIEKIGKLVLVWVMVYVVIALPLWCQYGWCCCCCRCKFCRPREQIEEIKTFYVRNPVGILLDDKGKVLKYQPTSYEKYAQKKLGKALDRL